MQRDMSSVTKQFLALPVLLVAFATSACAGSAYSPSVLDAERAAAEVRLAQANAKVEAARREERDAIAQRELLLELRSEEARAVAEHGAGTASQPGVAEMQPPSARGH